MTEKQRIAIIKLIINQPFFLGQYSEEEGGIVDILEMIWELHTMPSMDGHLQRGDASHRLFGVKGSLCIII